MNPIRYVVTLTLLALFYVAASPTLAQNPADEIDALLVEADWNGVALVASQGEVVLERGYGFADFSTETPFTVETRVLIASVTKQFTAALILLLMENGLLDLHVPISTYLPDYPQPQADQITLHHLLTHTAGIPNYVNFPDFIEEISINAHTPAELVALFSDLPLEFEPGTQFRYGNSDYVLLGYIIETVTGQSYAEALQERIFTPFELNNTGYPDPNYEGIATGYEVGGDGTVEPAGYLHPSVPYAAFGLYSNAPDLYRWDQILYGDDLFEHPATKALFFAEHVETPFGQLYYAYGWYVGLRGYPELPEPFYVVGHSGLTAGFGSFFTRFIEDGHTLILSSNAPPANPSALFKAIEISLYTFPTAGEEPTADGPTALTLSAPYPNPVRTTTTLPFTLTSPTDVRLALYDVLGREVTVLTEGIRPAGSHTVTLNTSHLTSGLYVARLSVGDEVFTQRLTVVR
jgi:CubicO group peptidase (beta-lactamase class C family)